MSLCSGVPTLDDSSGSALQADDPHQRSAWIQASLTIVPDADACTVPDVDVWPLLILSHKDPNEEALELATPTDPVVELLKQGAGKSFDWGKMFFLNHSGVFFLFVSM